MFCCCGGISWQELLGVCSLNCSLELQLFYFVDVVNMLGFRYFRIVVKGKIFFFIWLGFGGVFFFLISYVFVGNGYSWQSVWVCCSGFLFQSVECVYVVDYVFFCFVIICDVFCNGLNDV